jgi:hypothetical protein
MNRRKFLLTLAGAAAAIAAGASMQSSAPPLAPVSAAESLCNPLFSGELGSYNGVRFHESDRFRPVDIDGEEYYVMVCTPDQSEWLRDAVWRHPPVYEQLDFWT